MEEGVENVRSIEKHRLDCLQNIAVVQNALNEMHRDVNQRTDRKIKDADDSDNRKTNIQPINFGLGYFVIQGLVKREVGRKLSLKWKGPYRILEAKDNYIFKIKELPSGKVIEAHG